jgi:hypothetical protein
MIVQAFALTIAQSLSARLKATEASARALQAREASQPVGYPCDVYGAGYESEYWKRANGSIVLQSAYPELFSSMGHVPLVLTPTLLRARPATVSALAAPPDRHWRRMWADSNGFSCLYVTDNDGSGNAAVRLLSTTNFSTWVESAVVQIGSFGLMAQCLWGGYCRGLILPSGFNFGVNQSLYTISGTGNPVGSGLGGYLVAGVVTSNRFCVALWDGTSDYSIRSSATGLSGSWTGGSHPTGVPTQSIGDLHADGTRIFCVIAQSTIWYSDDGGLSWTTTGISAQQITARDGVLWATNGGTVRAHILGTGATNWPIVGFQTGSFGPVVQGFLYGVASGSEQRAPVSNLASIAPFGMRTSMVANQFAELDGFLYGGNTIRFGAGGVGTQYTGITVGEAFSRDGVVRGVGTAGVYALPKPYDPTTEFQLPNLSAAVNYTKMVRVK